MHNKNLALGSQPQVCAPPIIGSSGPSMINDAPGDVVNKSGRSASSKVDLMTRHLRRDLTTFKSDMTSLIQDMIQSSQSTFTSQFKSDSGGKGDSSQDRAHKISREPSPDQVDPSERERRRVGF